MSLNFSKLQESLNSLSSSDYVIGLTVLECIVAVPVVYRLKTKKGKGGDENTSTQAVVSQAIGDVIMYGPSAALAYYKSTLDGAIKAPKLLMTYFGKKAFAQLLMDVKAGEASEETMPALVALETGVFYTVGTALLLENALPTPQGIDMGQVIFWLGNLGNSLHVYLLNEQKKSKKRGLPTLGLFGLDIAAPHMLCDIVAMLGVAACARTKTGWAQVGLAVGVLGLQAARFSSDSDNQFDGSSRDQKKRWILIPYIW